MDVTDLLSVDRVVPKLKATSKKQVLQELARKAADRIGRTEREVFDVLLERERLGSTGVGSGIAIPHGKLPGLDGIYGLFARLEKPVSFDAIDEQPVDLVFLLLAPEDSGADHLKALARVSRLLRERSTCDKLRAEDDSETIYAILTESGASRAA